MKTLLALSLLALCAPALADTQDLASRPQAYVEDGVCHIHGAVWDRGPVRGARLTLREVGGPGVHQTRTDHRGEYQISIPVSERAGFTAQFQETGGQARSVNRHSRWSTPTVECRTASVSVGVIEKLP